MTSDAPAAGCSSADLIRSVDRAVRVARCGRLVSACGVWGAAAAAIVVASAAIDVASGGRIGMAALPSAVKIAIVLTLAAVPVAAVCHRRFIREGWPGRLGIALATERRHPRLGESLSRAVEFLESSAAEAEADRRMQERHAAGPAATGQGFRQLAIDQAAAAARDVGGLAIPGMETDVGWTAAGLAAAAAVAISTMLPPGGWGDAVRRQLTTPGRSSVSPVPMATPIPRPVVGEADAPLPADAAAAAARLAATVVVERRLADLLATLFTEEPGVPAESLARGMRRELDDLAEIQVECLHAVDDIRGLLSAAVASARRPDAAVTLRLRGAVERLELIDREAADAIPPNISANRLRLASDGATVLADLLASAASSLDVAVSDLPWQGGGGGTARGGSLAAAAAAIERMAARHDRDRTPAATSEEPSSARPEAAAGAGRGAAAATDAGGDGRQVAPTDPAGGAVSVGRAAPVAADAAPIEQVWSLLSATERAHAARAAVEAAPAAYRTAIDAYYRALLQSMPDQGSRRPSVPPAPR